MAKDVKEVAAIFYDFTALLRIRDVYPGSGIRIFFIPDLGSRIQGQKDSRIRIRIKEFILSPKIVSDPGCSSWIPGSGS
jgi:hypothetical protein